MNADDDMRDEYDFSTGGVVGKYYDPYRKSMHEGLLDPDLREEFPNWASVNRALRQVARQRQRRRRKPAPAAAPSNSQVLE